MNIGKVIDDADDDSAKPCNFMMILKQPCSLQYLSKATQIQI